MFVKVAGYNVDADLLGQYKEAVREMSYHAGEEDFIFPQILQNFWNTDNLTPETISAAYARISRYPEAVGELRRMAARSVARARKSNQTIVYEYGHASVAEHAVFNIDITGISRLAVETVESRRLMSYTEKSQRYIALSREYIVPKVFNGSSLGMKIRNLCESSFEVYEEFLGKIEEYADRQNDEQAKYTAREDARYILPLACGAQLGMTGNARNIEHLLRRTLKHPLEELQDFGVQLKYQVEKIAPSLVRHLEPEQHDEEFMPQFYAGKVPDTEVDLVNYIEEADTHTLTGMIFSAEGLSCYEAYEKAEKMDSAEGMQYLKEKLKGLREFHALPRSFETANFGFQLVLSSSAYAQLKRHRLTLQLVQPYEPELGYIIPDTIVKAGLEDRFRERMEAAREVYDIIKDEYPYHAPYALTNAHKRVVYFQANARELYHLARMRMDEHAQWDIRNIVSDMINQAKAKAPLTMALACGKDRFGEVYDEFSKYEF